MFIYAYQHELKVSAVSLESYPSITFRSQSTLTNADLHAPVHAVSFHHIEWQY